MLAKATARPWREQYSIIVSNTPLSQGPDEWKTTATAYVGDEFRHRGGLCTGAERDANAALIVAAVNAYEPMREALKIARDGLIEAQEGFGDLDAESGSDKIGLVLARIAELVPEMGE